MAENKNTVRELIGTIGKINNQPKNDTTLYDVAKAGLTPENSVSTNGSKNTKKQDVFGDLINTFNAFTGTNGNNKNNIRRYAEESSNTALRSAKQILINEIKNKLFIGDGACGSNIAITKDAVMLEPKEFDLTNMLKISPDSTSGSIMYENTEDTGEIKMNREFYNLFDNGGDHFHFNDYTGNTLFSIYWDESEQKYNVSGLTASNTATEFIDNYYSMIDFPRIDDVIQQAMLMTIQGDGNESSMFKNGMNMLDRLLNKILSSCGEQASGSPLNQTDPDEDLDSYFNFDDVEGIKIDDEDAKFRRVLKFTDCNNFETSINPNHIEDFVYFTTKKNISENITNTLNKIIVEIHEKSDKSVGLDNLRTTLTESYILNIPRAMISTLLSPKMLFPIVVLTKIGSASDETKDIKDTMKTFSKLFFSIIKKIFWKFIKVFWGFMKKELLNFVKNIALKIIKDKLKRWKTIIIALISLLTKLATTSIDSCDSVYKTMLDTIKSAMNTNTNIPIPGILLLLSDSSPGYSTEKAYINIINNLTSAGIETGQLYGRDNKLNNIIKAILEGHTKEMDENSFVKITLKGAVLPSSLVSTYVTPGTVIGVGKVV